MTDSNASAHQNYSPPLAAFLTLGWPEFRPVPWRDYTALGVTAAHIPQLIAMATDEQLHARATPDDAAVWAPVHAWRALGQLRAAEAARPLSRLFDMLEDDDWVGEDLPHAFVQIGPPAVPVLAEYVDQVAYGTFPRATAAEALMKLANAYPNTRGVCVAALTTALERFVLQDPLLNGLLVWHLIRLHAVEAAPVMERAYAADCVDLTVEGDWEDVQVSLGLLAARYSPPVQRWDPDLEFAMNEEWRPAPPEPRPWGPKRAHRKDRWLVTHALRRRNRRRRT